MTANNTETTANDIHLLHKSGTTMNVRIDSELMAALEKYAKDNRVTKSVAIRMLMLNGLRERKLI